MRTFRALPKVVQIDSLRFFYSRLIVANFMGMLRNVLLSAGAYASRSLAL